MQSFDIWYISVGQILLKLHHSNWKKADQKFAIFYRTAFHSSKWLIFPYLSIQLLWCNFKSIWPKEMYYISKDCIFNGRSAGTFRFSVECILTEIYWAQVWKFFLHQTLLILWRKKNFPNAIWSAHIVSSTLFNRNAICWLLHHRSTINSGGIAIESENMHTTRPAY